MSGCRGGLSPGTEQGGGGEAGARVLPLLPAHGGGEGSRLGPWRADSGIHPGSCNNLETVLFFVVFCFFSKRRPPR